MGPDAAAHDRHLVERVPLRDRLTPLQSSIQTSVRYQTEERTTSYNPRIGRALVGFNEHVG